MGLPISGNEAPKVSAATATKYVKEMVDLEAAYSGTNEAAFRKLAKDYGVTVSQLVHLYKAKAKKCDVSLFATVKAAYFDYCAKKAARLLHNIQMGEAACGDAHDGDLVDRLAAIIAEAQAKTAAIRSGEPVK